MSLPPLPPDLPASFGLELAPGIHVPESEMRWAYSRSGGPGGQNVNKLATRVELWLSLSALPLPPAAVDRLRKLAGQKITSAGELHLTCSVHRTQQANRHELLDRLRKLLIAARRPPKPRRPTRPSASSRRRRLQTKKQRARVKSLRGSWHDDD